jgi:D-arabinose 1-dehydrogenase-like Zn-dependent alcohol dehydrogenase
LEIEVVIPLTAYFATDIAKVKKGKVVIILGCGPVGQFAIASCKLSGSSRIFAFLPVLSKQKYKVLNINLMKKILLKSLRATRVCLPML